MNDIAELERRITFAMERIGRGVEGLSGQAQPGAELEEARAALEAERASNAQLVARVTEIRDRQQNLVGQLEKRVSDLTRQIEAHGAEISRLKRANHDLIEASRALRESKSADGAESDAALRAELSALRAERLAEVVELDEILAELRPLIGETANA